MNVSRAGVIAIGSNSTRMLTADLDASLSNPVRGREETALFLSINAIFESNSDCLMEILFCMAYVTHSSNVHFLDCA